jgi:hypothetical protein
MKNELDIQNAISVESELIKIIGERKYNVIKDLDHGDQINIILDYIIDNYSIFFEKNEIMESIANQINILFIVDDHNYELTDEKIGAIMTINSIVEADKDIPVEIAYDVKILLLYILELMK